MNEVIPDANLHNVLSWIAILKAVLMLIGGWLLAGMSSRLFKRGTRFTLTPHQLSLYSRLIFYVIFAIFAVSSVRQLGFDITVLLGAAGIFTVALGFASQTSASNLISGLFLLGEKPFQVGDILRVDGDTGEVVSVDLLSVKLRTFDNLFVRIPNELMIKNKFINLTKYPIRRIDLAVGVAYRENLQQVTRTLLEVATAELRCLEEPQPVCQVTNFGTSSIDLQLSVWGRREVYRELKSDLMMAIKAAFEEQNIEIPYPHVTLFSRSPGRES